MDDIPRVWIDRDPRNPQHVAAALRLIARLTTGSYVTGKTIAELERFGIFPDITGMRVGEPDTVDCVIGGFFFLDRGKLFPDNFLVSCDQCRAALQVRPHTNAKARKLCCFCAVDALLIDRGKVAQ